MRRTSGGTKIGVRSDERPERGRDEALDEMMWGCVAILAIAVVLSVSGGSAGYLLVAVPEC